MWILVLREIQQTVGPASDRLEAIPASHPPPLFLLRRCSCLSSTFSLSTCNLLQTSQRQTEGTSHAAVMSVVDGFKTSGALKPETWCFSRGGSYTCPELFWKINSWNFPGLEEIFTSDLATFMCMKMANPLFWPQSGEYFTEMCRNPFVFIKVVLRSLLLIQMSLPMFLISSQCRCI